MLPERVRGMDIYHGIQEVKKTYPHPVITVGVFDGLHRGHQRVIKKTVALARKVAGAAIVITFDPHPQHVLHPQQSLPLIQSPKIMPEKDLAMLGG